MTMTNGLIRSWSANIQANNFAGRWRTPGWKMKHNELRVQVLYRVEQYKNSFTMYREIIRSSDDKYETERKTNLFAMTAQMADNSTMVMEKTEGREGLGSTGDLEEDEADEDEIF